MGGGKKGGAEIPVDLYFMSLHFGICMGADALRSITIKEKLAWSGHVATHQVFPIHKPKLFGGDKKEGGVSGRVFYLPGDPDQLLDDELAVRLGRSGGADCPGFRGLASLFFVGGSVTGTGFIGQLFGAGYGGKKGFYWTANNPYLPGVWAEVRRAPVGLTPEPAMIPRIGSDFFPHSAAAGSIGLSNPQLSPDGNILMVIAGTTYELWNTQTQTKIGTYSTNASGGVAMRPDGTFYALNGFFGQEVILVSGGTESVVVAAADIPVILSDAYYVGGMVCFTASASNGAFYLLGSTIGQYTLTWRANFAFSTVEGNAIEIGENGGNISFIDMRTGDVLSVPSPDSGAPYAMDNGLGKYLVAQGDTLALVDKATMTVTDSVTITSAFSGENEFRNVMPGASSIWLGFTEYSTASLEVIRTIQPDDWTPESGDSFQTVLYIPSSNSIVSKTLFSEGGNFTWRLIDRGELDANPAHMIYECLTDTNWGMGSPSSLIDVASFEAAAEALYDEQLGLSMIWTRQAAIQDFVQEVLDHIQAVLFVDPTSGLLTLKLIRGDYDVETLPELTPSNADLTNFGRKLWGEIINEIVVTWTNPENEQDETVSVHDLASIATQGGVVSDGRNYYGVRSAALAQRLAQRDLRSSGAPLATCEAEVDRTQWQLRPASCVKLQWPEYGLAGTVMRVTEIDYGRPGDPTIKLSLVEDVFGLDVGTYVEPPATLWEDTSAEPSVAEAEVITLPYYAVSQAGLTDGAVYPEVQAGVLATTDNDDAWNAELWGEVGLAGGGSEWQQLTNLTIIGRGLLAADLAAESESSATFTEIIGQTLASAATFALLGTGGDTGMEMALIATGTAGTYTLTRGVLDTVPRAWAADTPVWFLSSDDSIMDPTVRSAGEEVSYRLLTSTSQGQLSLLAAPMENATLTDRPWLPLRPANVAIGGVKFNTVDTPVDMTARPNPWVTVSWANRNRLTEDTQVLSWTAGDVTPEPDQTTTITVYAADGVTELDVIPDLTGTSYDVPDASFGTEEKVLIRVSSSRTDDDGTFESLQAHSLCVQVDIDTGPSPLPSGVPAPVAWYDADYLTGADGDPVTPFVDRVGDFDAAVATAAGTLRTNSLNGLQTVEFNGTSSSYVIDSALLTGATEGSFFAVFMLDADPPGADAQAGAILDCFTSDTSIFTEAAHTPYTDGHFYEHFGSLGRHDVGNPSPSFTTARIYNVDCAASDFKARIDGAQIYSSSSNTVSFGTKQRHLGFTLGAATHRLDGKIAEVIIYDSVLTQTEREKVEGYLAHKWFGAGASNNLDSGHPYKTTAP